MFLPFSLSKGYKYYQTLSEGVLHLQGMDFQMIFHQIQLYFLNIVFRLKIIVLLLLLLLLHLQERGVLEKLHEKWWRHQRKGGACGVNLMQTIYI